MPGSRITAGERVTLRSVEQEDVPFLQRASADPEIRYPLGTPLRNQEAFDLSEEDADRLLVCLDGEDAGPGQPDEGDTRRIGCVSVEGLDYRRPELGYWLIPEVHGQGYGKEGVALVIDYVFRSYDKPAIGASAFDHNDASRGLLESLGFTDTDYCSFLPPVGMKSRFRASDEPEYVGRCETIYSNPYEEGRRRKFMFVDGEHRDMVQYGLLREEWLDGQ